MELVVGPLVGAGIAGVVALVTLWVNSRREHRHWLRQERLKACVGLVGALDHHLPAHLDADLPDPRQIAPVMTARASVELVHHEEVIEAANELVSALLTQAFADPSERLDLAASAGQARNEFIRLARLHHAPRGIRAR